MSGPFLAASVLLVVAGLGKLADPTPLVRALRSARLPAGPALVRVVAASEVLLGGLALVTGARLPAVLVALSYAAFTGFVLLARARGGVLASCGCFGKQDTPPTLLHAMLTGAVATCAAAVAVAPHGNLAGVLDETGLALVPAAVALAVCLYLALALLPLLARPVPL